VLAQDPDADTIGFTQQRFEDGARPVAVGKELAVFLFVKRDAELGEECRAARRWKRAQNVAHAARGATPEIVLGDDAVGDVTA
jgi:hypothetical protein